MLFLDWMQSSSDFRALSEFSLHNTPRLPQIDFKLLFFSPCNPSDSPNFPKFLLALFCLLVRSTRASDDLGRSFFSSGVLSGLAYSEGISLAEESPGFARI